MTGYLLDTNHLSDTLNPVSRIRDRIRQAQRAGVRFGICVPVLCEVEAGIQHTARPADYRKALDRMLEDLRTWPVDRDLAEAYGEVYLELRQQGRVLSFVDMILVALARRMGLTLLTTDRDFEGIKDLSIENWLAVPGS